MSTTTYVIGTDVGKVRLLCRDTDVDNALFNDDEINAFLAMESNDVRMAAALALETIAADETLVLKRISLMNLSTDGPAVAKSLRESAQRLREQAEMDAEFDWAEMTVDQFSAREIARNEWLREGS